MKELNDLLYDIVFLQILAEVTTINFEYDKGPVGALASIWFDSQMTGRSSAFMAIENKTISTVKRGKEGQIKLQLAVDISKKSQISKILRKILDASKAQNEPTELGQMTLRSVSGSLRAANLTLYRFTFKADASLKNELATKFEKLEKPAAQVAEWAHFLRPLLDRGIPVHKHEQAFQAAKLVLSKFEKLDGPPMKNMLLLCQTAQSLSPLVKKFPKFFTM